MNRHLKNEGQECKTGHDKGQNPHGRGRVNEKGKRW
jgi:hypothetical protein